MVYINTTTKKQNKRLKKDVYIKDNKYFYKNVNKYYYKQNSIIHFMYNDIDITNDAYLKEHNCDTDLMFKICTIHALNIKDIKKRYCYIYDSVCNYLDNEFKNKNICVFCNGKCISSVNNSYFPESLFGCCYGRKRGNCKYLKNNECSIKSISCKLFTCKYLKKRNIKYTVNDIPLLKYFFNIKQKYIISISMFKDKEEMIELLMKNRCFPKF